MEKLIKNTNNKKALYSQKGIGIATFLGSPFASSVLIRHNYVQLGDERKGKIAILLGAAFTIAMFVTIFSIPESAIDKIPQQIIPSIYTVIVYFIVDKLQGERLKQFEEEGGIYMSNWKAAGIGIISLIIIFGGIMTYIFLDPETNAYENGIQQFTNNEESATKVYNQLNSKTSFELITEINSNSIPKWEQNIKLLDSLSTNLNLDREMISRNTKLKRYSEMRIEELGYLKQGILLNTIRTNFKIDSLNREMQKIINELN